MSAATMEGATPNVPTPAAPTANAPTPSAPTPLFEPGDRVAVLGLGASGVAASRLAAARGARVYASDAAAGEAQTAAARELAAAGIEAEAGCHDLSRILASRLVVVSPGIDPAVEVRREVTEAGVRAVAEVELAFRYLESRLIAITGTNGKTTTTRLCGHVMAAAEWSALTAGNVGRPLSEVALLDEQPDWVVAELSSFQLADCERFLPDIGVVLNLAPDHLDRYASVESYYADKRRLFDRATPDSRWIVNADDPDVLAMVRDVPGRVYRLSVAGPVEPGAFLSPEGDLCLNLPGRRERWLGRDELRLLGAHNVTNALAAGLAAALAGCPGEAIAAGLRSFEGLPHRLRPVTELGGVLWVNDSKATNCSATRVALRAFDRKIVLLLGGRDKGEPYASLIPDLRGRLRGVVAFGEAAPKIVADLKDAVPELRVAGGMEALVRAAADMARPGDVVLFSPACSSYDMFPNYKERGWALERRIRDLCRECAPAEASRRADEASEGFTGEGRE